MNFNRYIPTYADIFHLREEWRKDMNGKIEQHIFQIQY